MDIKPEWLNALRAWAAKNESIYQLWLFGSRVKGTSRPDSDIDIALELMPATGTHNWALAAYVEFFEKWKQELRDAVGWDISLTAIGPGCDMDEEVRATGVVLWRRRRT
jgi:predicted nucleotidyltransferase